HLLLERARVGGSQTDQRKLTLQCVLAPAEGPTACQFAISGDRWNRVHHLVKIILFLRSQVLDGLVDHLSLRLRGLARDAKRILQPTSDAACAEGNRSDTAADARSPLTTSSPEHKLKRFS